MARKLKIKRRAAISRHAHVQVAHMCGLRYKIEITRADRTLEIKAHVLDPGLNGQHPLHANVCNLNWVAGQLLTERELASGRFEDSWFTFPTIARARRAYGAAEALCRDNPREFAAALDDDRAAGEWEPCETKQEAQDGTP
jgi:hypothetical protein